ncbi:hypothetical protein DMA15_13390 [Streptomyces sp. WAC 01529]|uniref:hypothetical protein n=1 Tax=Streptomyces sp. WAC 01529 TaxID=2203205 RepID=UPI000F71CF2D|nr:hypothetical protein [Streptomyces sp. WAC 01529]AZM53452.1 hypothetical protein DMA15_13390 [Streptomyces sp. WAC 01529]
MRIRTLALRAGPIALALALAGPATGAQGHEDGAVRATVTPAEAPAGAGVEVSVSGCEGTTGSAGSGAFEGDAELTGRDGGKDSLNGKTKIRSGLSGSYEVTVICDGHPHQRTGTVRVIQRNPEPVSPVRAGGGGTARFPSVASAGADEAGPGTRHAVVGLVLAGAAAVAVAFRGIRRRSRSE